MNTLTYFWDAADVILGVWENDLATCHKTKAAQSKSSPATKPKKICIPAMNI
jgi:hypothetical protein